MGLQYNPFKQPQPSFSLVFAEISFAPTAFLSDDRFQIEEMLQKAEDIILTTSHYPETSRADPIRTELIRPVQ